MPTSRIAGNVGSCKVERQEYGMLQSTEAIPHQNTPLLPSHMTECPNMSAAGVSDLSAEEPLARQYPNVKILANTWHGRTKPRSRLSELALEYPYEDWSSREEPRR